MSKFFAIAMIVAVTGAGIAVAEDAPAPKKEKADVKADSYPLKTCLVSGEEFGGDMGEPVTITRDGRTIKLCCNGCIKKFDAEPAKFLKILDEAEKKAKDDKEKADKDKK